MRSPASRGLGGLALACVTAALFARGLSSGTGQAIESPGSVLVLDAIGAVGAMAALGARFLEQESGLVPDRGVLAALGAFLALVWVGALQGAAGSWRTAFSWTALAALGLAVRDLARRKDVARTLAGVVVGVATASALLGLFDFWFVLPAVRKEVEDALKANPASYPIEALYRVSDPMATGAYLLPSHFACALGMALPLVLVVLVATVKRARAGHGTEKGALAAKDTILAAVLGLALVAMVGGIALAKSKGATLALGVGLLALVVLTVQARLWRRRLLALLAVAFVVAGVAGAVRYVRHPDSFGMGLSVQVRVEYWRVALGMAKAKPLTGHGLEEYPELYSEYKTARAEEAKHAHQDLLELLAELGVLGPVAFLALVFALGRAGVHALRTEGPPRAPPLLDSIFAPGPTAILGVALGALMLLGYGDVYNGSRAELVVVAGVIAALVSRVAARALEERRWEHAAGAAALAGALVFLGDGFTDFPLRVHGLVACAFALAFLAPALAEGPSGAPVVSPVTRVAIGLPLAALLVLGQYRVREDTAADSLRTEAREKIGSLLQIFRTGRGSQGKPLTADERANGERMLDDYTERYRRLLESGHLGVPDMLLLFDAQEYQGRLARDPHRLDGMRAEIEGALARYPHARELWSALGRLEAQANLLEKATAAYDRAAGAYPTQPHTRLAAAVVRMMRIGRGDASEKLRLDAIHECRAALACAYTSRLERVHLTEEEVAAAQGFLVALGAAPELPGHEEPEPALGLIRERER